MAEFELWVKGRFRRKFNSDTDPTDAAACVDLLRAQARAEKVRASDAELRARDSAGRKHGPYRTS